MTLTGKVTKGSNDAQEMNPSKGKKKTTAATKQPEIPIDENVPKQPEAVEEDKELHLDEALRRRMDWTPPRDTSPQIVPAVEDEGEVEKGQGSNTTGGFDRLLSDYNYSAPSTAREIPFNVGGEGPTKRRRIELVDPLLQPYQVYQADSIGRQPAQGADSSTSDPQPKKKPKGPKRFTTLTARMTAQYTLHNTNDDDSATDEIQIPGKTKSKRSKGQTTEKDTTVTVLSPEAASRSLENQDLIFGTCSQLEREDSPQTLREMQQAFHESESLAFDGRKEIPLAIAMSRGPVSCLTGTRNLWEVAARSIEGSLVQAKSVDDINPTGTTVASKKENTKAKRPVNWEDDDWFDLDYGKPKPTPKKIVLPEDTSKPAARALPLDGPEPLAQANETSANPALNQEMASQQPCMPHYSGFTDAELTKQVAAFGFKSVRGRKKMIELLQKCWESKHGYKKSVIVQSQPQPLPQIDRAELSDSTQKQAHSTTTKAKPRSKGKTASAQSASSSSRHTATRKDTMTTTSSKKTSTMVAKSSHNLPSSYMDIEEIQDSEDEVIPSPSQVQKRYRKILSTTSNKTSEPSLDIRTKEPTASPMKRKAAASKSSVTAKALISSSTAKLKTGPSKRNSLPDLGTQITKAVRSQPQLSPLSSSSGSRIRPTWHEKILMYDPVILEDFTTWLNVEGLGLVGEDREAHVAAVREWCESKGICCCGKNNSSW